MQDKEVTSISCGAEHTVVATAGGEVYSWGWGRYGNLGDGERVDRCAHSWTWTEKTQSTGVPFTDMVGKD
jgi:alpha-tubulin suppressor-like RCC1 family protein